MRPAQPSVKKSPEASRCLEVAVTGQGEASLAVARDSEGRPLMPAADGDHPIVSSPTSRFLQKALNSPTLDSVSPPAGMLPLQMRTRVKTWQSRLPSHRILPR